MAASVIANQIPYDFYSLQFDLSFVDGESLGIIRGVEEVEYTATINRVKLYGVSRKPVARTDGDVEFEASITFLRSWYDFIVKKAREAGKGLAQIEMTLAVSYYAEDYELVTDTLTGVKFGEIGNSHSRSPDPLMVTVPLDVMNIYFNGMDVFGETL